MSGKLTQLLNPFNSQLDNVFTFSDQARLIDQFMVVFLWLHLPIAVFLVPLGYGTWQLGLVVGLVISLLGTVAFFTLQGTSFLRILNGIFLMMFSALFIQQQLGRIEMHFHIFGALAFLVIYKDWKAVLPAAGFIAVHHLLFNYCQENSISFWGVQPIVFNYGTGFSIVLVHAAFVIFESVILIYYTLTLRKQQWAQNRIIENLNEERAKIHQLIGNVSETTTRLVNATDEETGLMNEFVKMAHDQAATLEQMASAMDEVSTSIDNIARTTREESESMEEVESHMIDLTARTQEMSMEMQKANRIVLSTTEHATQGGNSLQQMVASMDHISDGSQKMLGIVSIINEIADRVNLLSLNASIEAARAGDAGRGFAVVAEEISKLADQTASSIGDINGLIQMSTEEVNRGKSIVEENSKSIQDIIEDVKSITGMMDRMDGIMKRQMEIYKIVQASINGVSIKSRGIRHATEEQKQGITEVLSSISYVAEITNQNVSRSENVASIVEKTRLTSIELRDNISEIGQEA